MINYCFEFDDDNETISNYSKCRLWDFLECISFGDFLKFYEYYHKEHNIENKYEKLIPSIKSLRNACAHNNCILSQLKKVIVCLTSKYRILYQEYMVLVRV